MHAARGFIPHLSRSDDDSNRRILHKGAGFTLLELILSISILAILSTFGITSYLSFQANQELVQTRETLITNLRFAQNQAAAGVKNCGSGTLVGWYVKQIGSNAYAIYSRCVGRSPELYRQFALPAGSTIAFDGGSLHILFQPINKDVLFGNAETDPPTVTSTQAIITITKEAKSKTVQVEKTGDIK